MQGKTPKDADMGHSWPRKISNNHTNIL